MKSLDETIAYCDEVAEEQEHKFDYFLESAKSPLMEKEEAKCKECASEHRQLAEWLRELKKWRALRDSINMLCDVDCEYPQYRESRTMCDACPIGTVKEYFEQIFDGEV